MRQIDKRKGNARRRMPETKGAIFRAGDDDGQLRVKAHGRDVVLMPLERLHARLRLIIPDFDELVVSTSDQVRAIATGVVIDAIDALLVALQSEVRGQLSEDPHFDRAIKRGRRKRVRVFRVENDLRRKAAGTKS